MFVGLAFVQGGSKWISLPEQNLPLEDAMAIIGGRRVEVDRSHRMFMAPVSSVRVPKSAAWAGYGGLDADLRNNRRQHNTSQSEGRVGLQLFFFPGNRTIAGDVACSVGEECTVTVEWDGRQWRSRVSKSLHPKGWDPASRAEYLLQREGQVGVWFYNGQRMITHTFPGPRVRSLVLNEALLASGDLVWRHCKWRNICRNLVMRHFLRLSDKYPVGIVSYLEK